MIQEEGGRNQKECQRSLGNGIFGCCLVAGMTRQSVERS